MNSKNQVSNDWGLTSIIALILFGLCAITYLHSPIEIDGVRATIRLTARTSLTLFLLAFMASSLVKLFPSDFTKWILKNRRSFGLSFAFSHLIHAIAIYRLASIDLALFKQLTNIVSYVAGGSCYFVIIMLAITSLYPVRRLIKPQTWVKIHTFGIWLIWAFFLINFGKRVPHNPMYLIAIAPILMALAIRLIAKRKPNLNQ
ncbi:MAG: hypothetical protein J0L55_11405 [Caulobacterales bacterium]|nr:hypothetical protein [Caulobacterales bacterium]MCA0372934.1 hypothetical protein [Pseudomonadota bacterium]